MDTLQVKGARKTATSPFPEYQNTYSPRLRPCFLVSAAVAAGKHPNRTGRQRWAVVGGGEIEPYNVRRFRQLAVPWAVRRPLPEFRKASKNPTRSPCAGEHACTSSASPFTSNPINWIILSKPPWTTPVTRVWSRAMSDSTCCKRRMIRPGSSCTKRTRPRTTSLSTSKRPTICVGNRASPRRWPSRGRVIKHHSLFFGDAEG